MLLIQCMDGRYYGKPMWYGLSPTRWVIREEDHNFDLLLECKKKSAPSKKVADEVINNWKVKLGPKFWDNFLTFAPDWTRSKGYKFPLFPYGHLPVPTEYELQADVPDFSELKFCWSVGFPTEDVWKFFQKTQHNLNRHLAQFIWMDCDGYDDNYIRKHVLRRLYKQADLRGLSLLDARLKYGDKITITRPP